MVSIDSCACSAAGENPAATQTRSAVLIRDLIETSSLARRDTIYQPFRRSRGGSLTTILPRSFPRYGANSAAVRPNDGHDVHVSFRASVQYPIAFYDELSVSPVLIRLSTALALSRSVRLLRAARVKLANRRGRLGAARRVMR